MKQKQKQTNKKQKQNKQTNKLHDALFFCSFVCFCMVDRLCKGGLHTYTSRAIVPGTILSQLAKSALATFIFISNRLS